MTIEELLAKIADLSVGHQFVAVATYCIDPPNQPLSADGAEQLRLWLTKHSRDLLRARNLGEIRNLDPDAIDAYLAINR